MMRWGSPRPLRRGRRLRGAHGNLSGAKAAAVTAMILIRRRDDGGIFRPDIWPETRTGHRRLPVVGVPGMSRFDWLCATTANAWSVVRRAGLRHRGGWNWGRWQVSKSLAALQQTDPVRSKPYFPIRSLPGRAAWMQKDLARSLKLGRRWRGGRLSRRTLAKAMCARSARQGGVFREDFRDLKAGDGANADDYRGYDLVHAAPTSGGLTSLCILRTLGI